MSNSALFAGDSEQTRRMYRFVTLAVALALFLYILAVALNYWVTADRGGHLGLWKLCGDSTCISINADCTVGDTGFSMLSCSKFQASRAFVLLAIFVTGPALFVAGAIATGKLAERRHKQYLSQMLVLGFVFGLIAMSVFANWFNTAYNGVSSVQLGGAFACIILGWLVMLASVVLNVRLLRGTA